MAVALVALDAMVHLRGAGGIGMSDGDADVPGGLRVARAQIAMERGRLKLFAIALSFRVQRMRPVTLDIKLRESS